MQQLVQNPWWRGIFGVVLLLFGIGGIVAAIWGSTAIPLRYMIGGIVLALIGMGNIITARELAQQSSQKR